VTVQIQLMADIPSIAGHYLRVGVMEDNLSGHDNVLRDMLPQTALTIDTAGQTQEVTIPFAMGSWNINNLSLFAFVQRDSDRYILNAASSETGPYALSVGVAGATQRFVDGPTTFGDVTLMNIGLNTDTYDISLDETGLPLGWSAFFTIDGVDYYAPTAVTLAQFESETVNVTMANGGEDLSGSVTLDIHPQSGQADDHSILFSGIVGGGQILIVSDDGGANLAHDWFGPSIAASGRTYAVWDQAAMAIDAGTMDDFQSVVWVCGDLAPALDADERAVVDTYLYGGGRLFLSGQNVAANLQAGGGASWMIQRLGSYYQASLDGSSDVEGIADDPISDGIVLDLIGGDGSGTYYDPDCLAPMGTGSTRIFQYVGPGTGAGNRYENATYSYKTVFMTFSFETINAAADRHLVMDRVLDWLAPTGTAVGDELPKLARLHPPTPNPFNPRTKVSFDLTREGQVKVAVFDVTGRLVRVLMDDVRQAGRHEVSWDGRDGHGRDVASGTYFCRMVSADQAFSQKMTLMK